MNSLNTVAAIETENNSAIAGSTRYKFVDSFLGQGTYGKVEKAVDLLTRKNVAIKRVRFKNVDEQKCRSNGIYIGEVGMHFTTVREIKVMREIKHTNLMGVLDIYVQNEFMNLVMEVMETDLKKVLAQKILLTESHIKCILKQILSGICELHKWYITHRDLTPANIFLNKNGICKIADFGLSRCCITSSEESISYRGRKVNWKEQLTNKVVTLWYRAPELIFGASKYGHSVDMWSLGCIAAEIMLGVPLFPAANEIEQLSRIFSLCGTPSVDNWPDAALLQSYFPFTYKKRTSFKEYFPNQSDEAIDLLDKLLCLDPLQRISAEQALKHKYFSVIPLPCNPNELPLQALNL